MTTETISQPAVGVTWSGRSAPLLTLGRREAKRMLKSPVYIILAALVFLSAGLDSFGGGFPTKGPTAAAVYEGLLYFLALYAGLLTYIAVHLVASSSRRTHADRQLAASAMSPRARLGGLCLGVALGPSPFAGRSSPSWPGWGASSQARTSPPSSPKMRLCPGAWSNFPRSR